MSRRLRYAVYRLYAADGTLLYVGQSEAPTERVKDHRQRSPFGDRIDRVELQWFTNRCDALIHERATTRTLHPLYATVTDGAGAHRQACAYVTRDLRRGPKWYGDEPCDDPKAVAAQMVAESGYLDDSCVIPREEPTSHADYEAEMRSDMNRTMQRIA